MHAIIHCLTTVAILASLAFAVSLSGERDTLRRRVRELEDTREELDRRHQGQVADLVRELNDRAGRINADAERTKRLIEEKAAAGRQTAVARAQHESAERHLEDIAAVLEICVLRAGWEDVRRLADRGAFTTLQRDGDGGLALRHRTGLWLTTFPPEGADTGSLVREKTTTR